MLELFEVILVEMFIDENCVNYDGISVAMSWVQCNN